MMFLLLIITFTGPTASSSASDTDDNSTREEFELYLSSKIKLDQSLVDIEPSQYFIGTVFTVIGWVSSLVSIYGFVESLVKPEKKNEAETKLVEVLGTMNNEFSQVKVILDKLDQKLNILLVQAYHDVEKSVTFAIEEFYQIFLEAFVIFTM